MNVVEIRKLSTEDLTKECNKLRDEITALKLQLYSGELQNVKLIRMKRKDLARVLTVLGEQLTKESI